MIIKKIIIMIATFFLLLPMHFAQARDYSYQKIDFRATINQDSTVDIEETQTFNFFGNFHYAYRTISLKAFSGVSDVAVFDSDGKALAHSSIKLNKDDASSWNKYTYYRDGESENITWYFDESDTVTSWTLKYKLHGSLSFGSIYDRFYWNVFTDYTAPVSEVAVKVALPSQYDKAELKYVGYRTAVAGEYQATTNGKEVIFNDSNFASQEKYTIDVSWPKGAVDRNAFWKDFLIRNWGYLASFLIIFVAIISIIFLIIKEKIRKGRGTIIPEYAPPENLRPAMAEIVTKGALSDRGISATIIDLAVRGYLKIEEEPKDFWDKLLKQTNFKVTRTDKKESEFEDFEEKLLNIFGAVKNGDSFSTKEMKKANDSTKRMLYKNIQDLKTGAIKETSLDTQAFLTPPSSKLLIIGISTAFIGYLGITIIFSKVNSLRQFYVLLLVLAMSSVFVFSFIKYQARLSQKGLLLKEDWLGFRMYLEVAERYRMQNLTPEIFEKYLPYAMVFGIEKKWAANFRSVTMPNPDWYASNNATIIAGSGMSSFSPTTFTSSFSASFTSAISSSAGTGAAGGGSAGGGGGGGGGGAG